MRQTSGDIKKLSISLLYFFLTSQKDKQDEVDGIRAGAGEANSCNYDCADGNYSSIDFMTATSSGIIQEKGESEEDDDSYDEEER